MSEQKRKDGIKKQIESQPGISHTDLLERVKNDMAQSTAAKIIEQLLDGGEITFRKEGRKKRYHPAEPDQKSLEKDFAGSMKRLRRMLETLEDDFTSYPYEVQIWVNRGILDKLDSLGRRIRRHLEEHDHYYGVDRCADDYGRLCAEISKLMPSMRGDLKHGVTRCMDDTWSVGLLHKIASKASELRRQREPLGGGPKRAGMSEEIKRLDKMINTLFIHVGNILSKSQELQKVRKQERPPREYGEHELARHILFVEERRRDFQTTVQSLQKRAAELNGGKTGGDQAARLKEDPGLTDVIRQLESIKTNLDDAGKMLERQYRNTFEDEIEQEVYTEIKKAEEYVKDMKIDLKGM